MRYKANKWVLGLLLFFMVVSLSFISIKSTKAEIIPDGRLINKWGAIANYSNIYTLNNAQLCELANNTTIDSTIMGNSTANAYYITDVFSSTGDGTWLNSIAFKYLMLYQASELEPLNMNLYANIISIKIYLPYTENNQTQKYRYEFLLFGVNQSLLPELYNYIVDNNLMASNNTSTITLEDFEEHLQYVAVSGLYALKYGPSSTNKNIYLIFDEKPITFIAMPQNIANPKILTSTTATDQNGYPYTWMRLFPTQSLSSFAPVNMNNDRLLMQYYGYIDYWELTSQSITAIEGTAYQEGYDSGISSAVQDVLANPSQYGLYSSAQYTAYGLQQYNNGLAIGRETPYKTGDWFMTIFRSIGDILAIEIFPGLSIGLIVMIPLSISLAWFIIRTLRGGGN